jgi:hypothetical protein
MKDLFSTNFWRVNKYYTLYVGLEIVIPEIFLLCLIPTYRWYSATYFWLLFMKRTRVIEKEMDNICTVCQVCFPSINIDMDILSGNGTIMPYTSPSSNGCQLHIAVYASQQIRLKAV